MCKLFFFILLACFIISCKPVPVIDITNVTYNLGEYSEGIINADLTDAISKGIEIPTNRQTASGYFNITFQVNGNSEKNYFYKIYYQNETYKIPEFIEGSKNYNPLAEENFYGSWEDMSIGFKKVPGINISITDSIKITGNPRDEKKYYGSPLQKSFYNEEDVKLTAENIRANEEWFAAIIAKAKENNVNVELQLIQDAKWVLKNQKKDLTENNRWKRNPRMGTYSLMIVVITEDELAKLPDHIQYINKPSEEGIFISPYYFFNDKLDNTVTNPFVDTRFITVKALLNGASGILTDILDYPYSEALPSTGKCGWNEDLFYNAQFGRFFSGHSNEFQLNTIPLIQDVNDSSYTRNDYNESMKKYPENLLINDYLRNTQSPCGYVKYNEVKKVIEIINPGNTDLSDAHKSNIGIKTRIGFTYGKITAKIKFPELINKDNVWNGLTNAFWLLFQEDQEWNYRRVCQTGYTQKGDDRIDAPRIAQTHYSEIDFEIVKTNPHWPKNYYWSNPGFKEVDASLTDDIIVACTNWDLTCKDCNSYTLGVDSVYYKNNIFETMRWDSLCQALTTRTPENDDELFKSPYYYYQFEWTPDHIIWRIGPEKNKLKVVGYMDKNITTIPNNQMIAIITQEYHLSEWWPPIPFKQEYIPFPKSNITGEVHEITIE